jgi:hypothetical protein
MHLEHENTSFRCHRNGESSLMPQALGDLVLGAEVIMYSR